jgi:hypothetical protein
LIAATALPSPGLSALSSLSELTSALALLPSATAVSSRTCLATWILCSRSSGCLTRQSGIQQGLELILNLAIVRTRTLTAPSTLTASAGVRLA